MKKIQEILFKRICLICAIFAGLGCIIAAYDHQILYAGAFLSVGVFFATVDDGLYKIDKEVEHMKRLEALKNLRKTRRNLRIVK